MSQGPNQLSDEVTVLVFKDNYAARTFQVSLSWINRLGIFLGCLLTLTLVSGFLAIKYYRINLMSISATPTLILSREHSTPPPLLIAPLENATPKVTPNSYQFSAFPDANVGGIPLPTELSFTIQAPKLIWKGKTLLVRFALQYIRNDQDNQQGRIVILARSPESIYAYPDGILSLPGKNTLISPENGEFFSVSRYREVKADFGPLKAQETISSIEIFIFDTAGKILAYQTLTPPSAKKGLEQ